MSVPFFSDPFSQEIWEKKYAGQHKDVRAFFWSLATMVDAVETRESGAIKFFDLMFNKKFIPGGRILAYAGRPSARVSLMNCTTHTVQGDSLKDINDASFAIMKASSRGQGIGLDISKLRPMGAPVNNAASTSSGAISFMELLNAVGGTIGQNGRRGALLFSISDTHPDLWRPGAEDIQHPNGQMIPYDFLNIKRIPGRVENANISVRISDMFMKAAARGFMWDLSYEGTSGVAPFLFKRTVNARDLFNELARNAWASAEPGILYWDNSVRMSNSDLFGKDWAITGVNACSEQILDQEGVCNLGSMNLAAYVVKPFTDMAYFDKAAFARDVRTAVQFLDNVLTIEMKESRSISDRQLDSVEYLRRVGLGVMGLADAMAMLGIYYGNNPAALTFTHHVFETMRDEAYKESIMLAKILGPAKAWEHTEDYRESIVNKGFFATLPANLREAIIQHGTRNITLLSVAPTGSISNLAGVSSGIEPLFARAFDRKHRMNGDWETVHYTHPGVALSRANGVPDDIWVTTYQITPEDHVHVQAVAQQFVDQSISKTTNFPESATVEDIANVYRLAHSLGIKGMSVYRDNSRQMQVLSAVEDPGKEKCPVCDGDLVHESGCVHCSQCDWEVCSI